MLSSDHSINIYALRRCRWTFHLLHSCKSWGNYVCLNLDNHNRHSQVIVVPRSCSYAVSHSKCHISWLTPSIEVFVSILESPHHKLLVAYSIAIETPRLHGWEILSMLGALTHIMITWALSPTSPQVPGVTPGSPVCLRYLKHSSWRGARHSEQNSPWENN
jgi:hypothetical protein